MPGGRARSAIARTDWDADGLWPHGWRGHLKGYARRPGDDDAADEAGELRPAHRQPDLGPRGRDQGLA